MPWKYRGNTSEIRRYLLGGPELVIALLRSDSIVPESWTAGLQAGRYVDMRLRRDATTL